MTSRIGNSLDIYGPSACPACGNYRETIFAGSKAGTLTCRNHPGHPLFDVRGKHEAAPAPRRLEGAGVFGDTIRGGFRDR